MNVLIYFSKRHVFVLLSFFFILNVPSQNREVKVTDYIILTHKNSKRYTIHNISKTKLAVVFSHSEDTVYIDAGKSRNFLHKDWVWGVSEITLYYTKKEWERMRDLYVGIHEKNRRMYGFIGAGMIFFILLIVPIVVQKKKGQSRNVMNLSKILKGKNLKQKQKRLLQKSNILRIYMMHHRAIIVNTFVL
jgi:hypothetical protein